MDDAASDDFRIQDPVDALANMTQCKHGNEWNRKLPGIQLFWRNYLTSASDLTSPACWPRVRAGRWSNNAGSRFREAPLMAPPNDLLGVSSVTIVNVYFGSAVGDHVLAPTLARRKPQRVLRTERVTHVAGTGRCCNIARLQGIETNRSIRKPFPLPRKGSG